ncbi:12336_t:CDS:1, partial [Ambispora leptoticha]
KNYFGRQKRADDLHYVMRITVLMEFPTTVKRCIGAIIAFSGVG